MSNPNDTDCRVVVLISGNGSNLQALIDNAESYQVVATISNKADVYGLDRAREAGIDTVVIDHRQYPSREAFDQVLADTIDGYLPDLVVLAGFMRILSDGFVQRFKGRLINIHPSLLPKYPGLDTHQRALDAGDSEAGCSVHFVTEELDGGPCIARASVVIEAQDDADALAARTLVQEHRLYPLVANWFGEGRLALSAKGASFDGRPLPATGHPLDSEQAD